ncbi:MAG: hypothetical protein R3324_07740, partial [Halobacteriales archaeon]|nr:hypothetical protein [Halobacteriales archaeon]
MTWADDLTPREIGSRREYMHPAGVRVIFDHMHPTSRGIESWVEVRWQGNVPDPQLLTFGRFDLMGSTTADRLAKSAARVVKSVPEDGWGEIIRAAVYDTVREWLEGGEAVRLANVEESDAARWLLRPLIGGAGATSVVGAGGSHRSFVA